MKRFLSLLFLMILTLTGCSVKDVSERECVADSLDFPALPAFYLTAALPAEAAQTASSEDGRFTVFSTADYEIFQEIFPADSAEAGLSAVTGKAADRLSPIPISSFPHPEYRFAWTAAGENGPLSCLGTLLYDGQYCYALTIRCPVAAEKKYRETFLEILSSVSLNEV